MASYSSVTGNLAAAASAAYTLGQALDRSIHGDTRKVHFIQGNNTIIEFDAVMSEQHNQDAGPTVFPLEDGQTITDHVIITPFELSLTGIVSDSRIAGKNTLISEGITSAANLAAGPLGVLAAGAASKYNATILAQRGTTSPSAAAFNALTRLIAGNKDTGAMPAPFDVVTNLKRYSNMVLRSLQVPRDANSGNALIFTMSLVQLLLVRPQTASIQIFKNPAVAAHKAKLGEQEAQEANKYAQAYKKGANAADSIAGIPSRYPEAQ